VTVKEHIEALLIASETEQVTVVVPTVKFEPEGGEQTGVPTPGQLSEAVGGVKLTVTVHWPAGVVVEILEGQPISTGFSLSLTVTVKEHWAVSPPASVTVQETVVVPLGKAVPVLGEQTTLAPGQLSIGEGTV
jgi:hypothetical protein